MLSRPSSFSSIALGLARTAGDVVVPARWIEDGNGALLSLGVFEPAPPACNTACPECGGDAVAEGRWAKCLACSYHFPVDPKHLVQYRLSRDGLARLVEKGLRLRFHSDRGTHVVYHSSKSSTTVYFALRESDLKGARLGGDSATSTVVCGSADPEGFTGLVTHSIDEVFFMDESGNVGVNTSIIDLRGRAGRGTVNPKAKDMDRRRNLPHLYQALSGYASERLREGECEVSESELARQVCERIPGMDPENESDLKKVKRWAKYLQDDVKDSVFSAVWQAALRGRVKKVEEALAEMEDGIADDRYPVCGAVAEDMLVVAEHKFRADGRYGNEAYDPNSPFDLRAKFFDMDGDDHEDDDL